MPFEFETLAIPGLLLIKPRRFPDERGSFTELYQRSAFEAAGIRDVFVQDNLSRSRGGVVRGLHFQRKPREQAKTVTVLDGEIFDVLVDLRPDSPTFARWVGVTLSAERGDMLYVPAGFAHGYCVTGDRAVVHYKLSDEYAPAFEGGVRWDDPSLAIAWPIRDPVLSSKDAALPLLADARLG